MTQSNQVRESGGSLKLPGESNPEFSRVVHEYLKAFSYYRAGMSAQSRGRYAEALQNYYEALQVEEDPYDRSYTLYNIGLIYGSIRLYH